MDRPPTVLLRQPSVEDVAATKIQSLYRGASSRKQRALMKHRYVGIEQPPPAYTIPNEEGTNTSNGVEQPPPAYLIPSESNEDVRMAAIQSLHDHPLARAHDLDEFDELTIDDLPNETAPPPPPVEEEMDDYKITKIVRIQSLVRGHSLRRILADPTVPMANVDPAKRKCWHLNRRRRHAVELERPPAQILPPNCLSRVFGFMSFTEVARVVTVTCREWLTAARMPNPRQATLTLITHESLKRVCHSTLLQHIGSLHTSLRLSVSPLALNFDLFQSYFDLQPSDLREIGNKFPNLTELVTCIKSPAVATLVPQSPQGIHGHLYGGRTGQSMMTGGRRLGAFAPPTRVSLVGGGVPIGTPSPLVPSSAAGVGCFPPPTLAPHVAAAPIDVVFPLTLKKLVLELGLPPLEATLAIHNLSTLSSLDSLTLMIISELDLSPLLLVTSLRTLSIRYSNLSGKTTRLRFPRAAQYAVLRQMAQLRELEIEEGFLVETVHPNAQFDVRTSFLHELLLDTAPHHNHAHALAPPPWVSPAAVSSTLPASASSVLAPVDLSLSMPLSLHSLRLHQLHMEKTTLIRGNEVALVSLPSLTSLTPFRFTYDMNFAFLRSLPNLTSLHLHFSTSTSPPPPMIPLLSHLLTCTHLTDLSFRGVAFGAAEELILLTFLNSVNLNKFRLQYCTLPSLRCIQQLAPRLTSLTLDSCVLLAPIGGKHRSPHIPFPYQDFVTGLQRMTALIELYLNGTFETLPYSTLQLLTYPSVFFPSLKKLVLTQGSVMLSSYDQRNLRSREEVTLELDEETPPRAHTAHASDDDDDDDDERPPMLTTHNRKSKRHSSRPGFFLLRR